MKNKIQVFEIIAIRYSIWGGFRFALLGIGGLEMVQRG